MLGVESAARAGYAARGAIYALIGALAVQQAIGAGGDTSGTREAIRTFASGPFGRVVLVLLLIGLPGYVLWRLVQGMFDPVGRQDRALLLGSIGAGLVCYAGHQWVKARYRIIDL